MSWLLCHRSGLITTDRRMTFEEALDWDPVVEALADSTPRWEPGHAARLPRRHLRLARRRVDPPGQRQAPRTVLRRRGRGAARSRLLDRHCPRTSIDRVVSAHPHECGARRGHVADRTATSAASASTRCSSTVPGPGQPDRSRARARPAGRFGSGTRLERSPDLVAPRCRRPTASPMRRVWPGCTPRWSERSTASDSSRRRPSTGRSHARVEGPDAVLMLADPLRARASCSTPTRCRSSGAGRSATSAPAARSASRTRTGTRRRAT